MSFVIIPFGDTTCLPFCVRPFFSSLLRAYFLFPPTEISSSSYPMTSSPSLRHRVHILGSIWTLLPLPFAICAWLASPIEDAKIHHGGEWDRAIVRWTTSAQRFACLLNSHTLPVFRTFTVCLLTFPSPSRSRKPRNRSCAPPPFPSASPSPSPTRSPSRPISPSPGISTSSSAGTGAKQKKTKKSDRQQQHTALRFQVHASGTSVSLFAGKKTKVEQVVCGPWVTFQTTEPIAFFLFFHLIVYLFTVSLHISPFPFPSLEKSNNKGSGMRWVGGWEGK